MPLLSVTIPNTVETIESSAFLDCKNLTSITIPNSVTKIGSSAFKNCPNLTIYGYTNTVAETYANEKNIPFKSIGEYIDDSIGGTATNITNDQGIKLNVNACFDIPENIPSLGGHEFKLELDKVGISYVQEGSKFKLGVGVTEGLLKKDNDFINFKKYVESNKKNFVEGLSKYIESANTGKILSIGSSWKPKASVYGYMEGTVDSKGLKVGTGKIVAKFSA